MVAGAWAIRGLAGLVSLMDAQTPVAPPAPASEASGWGVTHIDTRCVILRHFGSAPNQVLFGVEPGLTGESGATFVLLTDAASMTRRQGSAELSLDGRAVDGVTFVAFGLMTPRSRIVTIDAPKTSTDAIRHAAGVGMQADGVTMRVRLAGLDTAWPAMERCLAIRRAELHLDPAFLHPAQPAQPIGHMNAWFSSDDFPARELQAGQQGISEIVWTIDPDGHVSDCRPVVSAGGENFVIASCRAMEHRGRFHPALDAAGRPVASYGSMRINWRLPN